MAEMMVQDFAASFAFRTGVLGFAPAFLRPAQLFACLEHPDGAQVMICQRDGDRETGPMKPPLGRVAAIQVYVRDVRAVAARMRAAAVPFYVDLREKWRDRGDRLGGQREFLVQLPDGYLAMVVERIGERPMPAGGV